MSREHREEVVESRVRVGIRKRLGLGDQIRVRAAIESRDISLRDSPKHMGDEEHLWEATSWPFEWPADVERMSLVIAARKQLANCSAV